MNDRFESSKIWYFLNSLQVKVFLLVVIIGIIPMVAMEHATVSKIREAIVLTRTQELSNNLLNISMDIGKKADNISKKSELYPDRLTMISDIFGSRIMILDSQMVVLYDSYIVDNGKTIIDEDIVKAFSSNSRTTINTNEHIKIIVPIVGNSDKIIGFLVSFVSGSEFDSIIQLAYKDIDISRVFFMIVIIICAFGISRMIVAPVKRIKDSIKLYSDGMKIEVNETGYSEMAELSTEFNKLFGKLDKIEESRAEFVSNVSHELKTPITSIKVLAESLNSEKDIPIEIYKDFMHDITNEINREDKIINDLLALVRLDKAAALNFDTIDINKLVESVLKRIEPIATEANIEIIFESYREVFADIDEVKVTLAVTNLVENAIKYNKPGGFVKVSVNADHKYFYIQVEDNGIGIPKDDQDRVFERFYRVDKTRSRRTGGTGLGLAITKDTVTMHGGAIRLESKENEGTKFIIRIPLTRVGGNK